MSRFSLDAHRQFLLARVLPEYAAISTLADVRKHATRGDWFAFQSALFGAAWTALQALFAQREVYWTGDKWKRAAMVRYGFAPDVIAAYDRLWAMQTPPDARIAALERLIALATTDTSERGLAAEGGEPDGFR